MNEISKITSKTKITVTLSLFFFILSVVILVYALNLVISKSSANYCEYNGVRYQNGQGFTNECNSCSCEKGEVMCTTIACEEESYVDDLETPTSDSCLYRGNIYPNNSNFPSPDDSCNTCTCNNGNTTCTEMNCFE